MADTTNIVPVLVAFFIIAASPGPATLACATVAMRHGRRNGHLFGLGLALGLAIWGLVAATGLGTVLVGSAQALVVMKLLGGCYLLWLAFRSGQSAMRSGRPHKDVSGQGRWLWRGVALNLSNPKAVLAWLAVLSLGTTGTTSLQQIAVMTGLCSVIGYGIYLGYVIVFSTGIAMGVYQRVARWVDGIVAGLFAVAGLQMIRSAFARG